MLNPASPYPKREERQLITDEIMFRLAKLLPEENRGYYSDLSKATTQFLDFDTTKEEYPGAARSPEAY